MFRFITMLTLILLALPTLAKDPLDEITIKPEFADELCERITNFGKWIDADSDGENTRKEVLISESLVSVRKDQQGKIKEGLWVGPYAGFITRDPQSLHVDHMVPLCEAWESGAHKWSELERKKYNNSLDEYYHLIATCLSTNTSKGQRDPADWLPPNRAYWCTYLEDWIAIKRKWELSMDQLEANTIRKGLQVCSKYKISDHINGRL